MSQAAPPPPDEKPKGKDWLPFVAALALFAVLVKVVGWPLLVCLAVAGAIYTFLASRPSGRPLDLHLSENLEAILISVAMALVLKFFVVEAYQIPTGSMQPTILGDRDTGIMDRILADKLITMLRRPERWEVMIFRFPLDERRLYVKRIVGLPGETLTIAGGDVWIDGAIARKPDHVNESVLKVVHPETPDALEVSRWFGTEGAVTTRGERADFGAGGGGLSLLHAVLDQYLHGYDPAWGIAAARSGIEDHVVSDLDLRATVRLDDPAATVALSFGSDEGQVRFVLPGPAADEGAALVVERSDGTPPVFVPAPAERTLPAGEEVEVLARHVDRQAVLWVDGDEWLRWTDDASGPRPSDNRSSSVRLTVSGAGSAADLRLRRDIHYLPSTPGNEPLAAAWEIPSDSYFGLGDNTQSSHDSRTWTTKTVVLRDGREITGFDFDPGLPPVPPDANPQRLADGRWLFADVHGDAILFHPREVKAQSEEARPFIHERLLLGKAAVVFWPVVRPFRWKLVR